MRLNTPTLRRVIVGFLLLGAAVVIVWLSRRTTVETFEADLEAEAFYFSKAREHRIAEREGKRLTPFRAQAEEFLQKKGILSSDGDSQITWTHVGSDSKQDLVLGVQFEKTDAGADLPGRLDAIFVEDSEGAPQEHPMKIQMVQSPRDRPVKIYYWVLDRKGLRPADGTVKIVSPSEDEPIAVVRPGWQ